MGNFRFRMEIKVNEEWKEMNKKGRRIVSLVLFELIILIILSSIFLTLLINNIKIMVPLIPTIFILSILTPIMLYPVCYLFYITIKCTNEIIK